MIYSNFIHIQIPDPDWEGQPKLHQYILIYFVERQIRTFTDIAYLADFLMPAPYTRPDHYFKELIDRIVALRPRDRLSFDIDYQVDVKEPEPGFELNAKEVATLICCTDITEELQQINSLIENFHLYRVNG